MIDRRPSRTLAMQALCLFDNMGEEFAAQLEDFLADEAPSKDVIAYARDLIRDVRTDLAAIDECIQTSVDNWELKRLNAIDRNVLRVAVCELMHRPSVPPRAAVNEAIEIAKEFGTKESAGFINGILDAIVKKRTPGTAATADA